MIGVMATHMLHWVTPNSKSFGTRESECGYRSLTSCCRGRMTFFFYQKVGSETATDSGLQALWGTQYPLELTYGGYRQENEGVFYELR